MRFGRLQWVLRDGETGGESGGGGGGDPAASPPAAAPAGESQGGAAPAPVAAGPAPASALDRALQDQTKQFHGTPEKYRVMREDGSLDVEATLTKTAEAYTSLERRFGAQDGPPPASPGDYKITLPDDLASRFDTADPGMQEFMTDAHAAGMSQRQMDVVMKHYGQHIDKLAAGLIETDQEACIAKLAEVWTDPRESSRNYTNAFRALQAYGGERAEVLKAKFGNDPDGIWMLAQIGAQMREDSPPDQPGLPDGGLSSKSDADLVADMASKDKAVAAAASAEHLRRAQAKAAAQSVRS